MTIIRSVLAVTASAAIALFTGCSTSPKGQESKDELHKEAASALANFKKQDPSLQALMDKSYGHAIFPEIGKGAVGVGGAYGRGEVYDHGKMIGYCDMSQATIGLQLGGQSYAELILFENKAALDRFIAGNFEFAAQASAVALKSGASANAKYNNGVIVFTATNGGLMYEASIGGQKFSYKPL